MRIKRILGIRSGHPAGRHVWILIAMFELTMDIVSCESLYEDRGFRHLKRPSQKQRFFHSPLWSFKSGQHLGSRNPSWSTVTHLKGHHHGQTEKYHLKRWHKHQDVLAGILHKKVPSKQLTVTKSKPSISSTLKGIHLMRVKRQLQRSNWGDGNYQRPFSERGSQPTMVSEVIIWGPTGEEDPVESTTLPGNYDSTKTSTLHNRITTSFSTTTTTASPTVMPKGSTPPLPPGNNSRKNNLGKTSTTEPYTSTNGNHKDVKPPRLPGETSGLAVHQIITITVSLIMVIAALITTLVLKNCFMLFFSYCSCAQSGNTRRNSHQRKINQQEESCQNLTDFTPARVPSNLDIFTAYNETLQCSHECVRTPLPVYTDETLHQTGVYKTTFNGNSTRKPIFLLAADPPLLIGI
ncbi:adherens junction-associated protein 1 isoform X2 [Ambystoma mexicanum]|uniref:adherens junction-associated protein 1 isoform X2 n=1 Tax=Ambystoma mexicanum TaxID=8296 RepID=UPI0037E93B87